MKECFVICPIGHEDSSIRKRSDVLFKFVYAPVLREHGFEPIRADQISEVGNITSQIISYILEAPLIIADLSGSNPNVFYELGIRHTIGKPYIQFINKNETLPFDVAALRSIPIDHTDLNSVESAKDAFSKQIEAYESGVEVHSPVQATIDIRNLRVDENLAENLVKEIYDLKQQLKDNVKENEKMMEQLLWRYSSS